MLIWLCKEGGRHLYVLDTCSIFSSAIIMLAVNGCSAAGGLSYEHVLLRRIWVVGFCENVEIKFDDGIPGVFR